MKTEGRVKVFSGKGFAMMHECKRLLNKDTSDRGLLFASRGGRENHMGTFFVNESEVDEEDAQGNSESEKSSSSHTGSE